MSINRVIISGNIVRDAVLRQTSGTGVSVLNFTVAVNDRRKNQQTGEWEDHANFIDCSIFGARANSLETYLKKGTKVTIEGKLRYSTWQDKQNPELKRHAVGVTVDELEFMSRRNDDGASSGATPSAPAEDSYVEDEDMPF